MSNPPLFSYVHPRSRRRLTLALRAGPENMSRTLRRQETYEPSVNALIVELLHAGDTAIDVGSDIGWHVMLAAECVGPTGSIYAYEPDPVNFAVLDANCKANAVTQVVHRRFAIGDGACDGLLWTPLVSVEDSRRRPQGASQASVSAKIVSLDDDLGSRLTDLRLVRIDVEGYEAKVLRGMSTLAALFRPAVLLEFWPKGIEACGDSVADILAFSEGFGYAPYLLTAAGFERSTAAALLQLSRTLLSPGSERFVDIALLQPNHHQSIEGVPVGTRRIGQTGGSP